MPSESPSSKQVSNLTVELTLEETELVLKALGYYQIHLYDEISKNTGSNVTVLRNEISVVSSAIKRIHRVRENATPREGISPAKIPEVGDRESRRIGPVSP